MLPVGHDTSIVSAYDKTNNNVTKHTQLQLPIDPALFGSLPEVVKGLLVILLDALAVEVHEAQPALPDGVVLKGVAHVVEVPSQIKSNIFLPLF